MRALILALTVGLATALMSPVSAEELASPAGEVVLSVQGDITVTNTETAATFDMSMLMGLPIATFKTTTIWTEGEKIFVGVPLASLLNAVGANGETIRATAINDYSVDIPTDTISDDYPIIAYEMDGQQMPRRQKGPLWIVYPYDSSADFRTEVVYSRSIWQLDRLIVVK